MKINNTQWKKIAMTNEEKSFVKARLVQSMHSTPTVSPYHPRNIFMTFGMIGRMSAVFSFLFIFIIAPSLTKNTLPGDFLYPLKVNVVEGIKSSTFKTKAEKIVWQKTRVEKRLEELNTLQQTGKLTPENQLVAEAQINTQLKTLNDQIADAKTQPNEEIKTAIIEVAKLEQTVAENPSAVMVLSKDTTAKDTAKNTDNTDKNTKDSGTNVKNPENATSTVVTVDKIPDIKKDTLQNITATIEQAKNTVAEITTVIDTPIHEDTAKATSTTTNTTEKPAVNSSN